MELKSAFADREFNRKLIRLTFPIAMQSLMLALVAAADAFMLGRFDQNAMAAVSLATQVQFVQNIILWAIVSGIGIMGAQYWGKGDIRVIGRIFAISVRLASLTSIAFFAACLAWPGGLMRLFANDPELLRAGAEYLKVAAWSYLLTGVSQCYLGVMKISGHVSASAVISSGAVVLNIVLNALFIFGLCGLTPMGVRGAALATVAARVAELALCIFVSKGKSFIGLPIRELLCFDRALSRDFLRYSLPVLGAGLLWGIGFTAYTALMGHLGADAAAANAIAAVVRDLMCCLCNGFSGAAGILIGNELGAGRLARGRAYGNRMLLVSLLVGLLCAAVILSCIPALSCAVRLTAPARDCLRGMLAILALYMVGRSICTIVINGVFSAGGDTLFDIYSLLVCMWGIALPCAFIGAFWLHLPVLAVYACTCLDEVGKLPWVLVHHLRYKWVKDITR